MANQQNEIQLQFNRAVELFKGTTSKTKRRYAVEQFRILAEKHHLPDAMDYFGWCLISGVGVKKDRKLGFQWSLKAARRGNPTAQFEVGLCYDLGRGTKQNKRKAFQWYLKAAEQDHDTAKYNVAQMYLHGWGTKKDLIRGYIGMDHATCGGDSEAYLVLGYLNFYGIGTPQNLRDAELYYRKSAKAGNRKAFFNLALMYLDKDDPERYDRAKAKRCLTRAAKLGHKKAARKLAALTT